MLGAVIVFSILIVALTLYGLASPPGYIQIARRFQSPGGLWVAFAIRALLAVVLWSAAPASATPGAFRVLAAITALGALALPLMGPERFTRLVDWGAGRSAATLRVLCVLGLALGLFLLGSSLAGTR